MVSRWYADLRRTVKLRIGVFLHLAKAGRLSNRASLREKRGWHRLFASRLFRDWPLPGRIFGEDQNQIPIYQFLESLIHRHSSEACLDIVDWKYK